MKKLILFELRKVFSKRLALIALIGIILFSALLSFSTFQNKYAFDQNIGEGTGKTAVKIDKEIAAKYEGILTDEKVQQMMSDFAPTHDLHGLNAMYLYQNATQSAAFSRFSDKEGNWNGLSVSDVFGNEEIKIGYVDGWLSTSKNMVRFFIALALAVIIMLAPIFSGEYTATAPFAVLHPGLEHRTNFVAGIFGVPLVHNVQKGRKVVVCWIGTVYIIIDGNEPNTF